MVACITCGNKPASYAVVGAEKMLRCHDCRLTGDVTNRVRAKCGCGKLPSFGPAGGKAVHCAGCRVGGDVNLKHKMCSTCGEKAPSFAPAGTKTPLRCAGCSVDGDVDIANKKCGCGKSPSFGPRGGRPVHCARCKVDGDINLKIKLCTTCKERAPSFAPAGAERPVRCGGCKQPGDVDVKHPKCPCGIIASFGPSGTKPVRCSGCKIEGVDVFLKASACVSCRQREACWGAGPSGPPLRCNECHKKGDVLRVLTRCTCGKQASFGPPGGKYARCAGCRIEGDVILRGKMCSTCGEKQPAYAPAGTKCPLRCGGCRVAGDLYAKGKRCGSGKKPSFGSRGGKAVGGPARRCGDCGIEGDVNFVSPTCVVCLENVATYGSKCEGARRCAGCRLPSDEAKNEALCRICSKNTGPSSSSSSSSS
jgi:hypothetical protein